VYVLGGNVKMKQLFPEAKMLSTKYEPIDGFSPIQNNEMDIAIEDGESFKLNEHSNSQLIGIHTPCHTKGHMCFIVMEEEDLHEENGDGLFGWIKSEDLILKKLEELRQIFSYCENVESFLFHQTIQDECFKGPNLPILLSGDMLFKCGSVGKFFEGNAKDSFDSR